MSLKKLLLASLVILNVGLISASAQDVTLAPASHSLLSQAVNPLHGVTGQRQHHAASAAAAVQSAQQSPMGVSQFAMIAPPHQVAQRYVGGGELTGDIAAISLFGTLIVLGAWLGRCNGKSKKE